jgi:hypothetical protein
METRRIVRDKLYGLLTIGGGGFNGFSKPIEMFQASVKRI